MPLILADRVQETSTSTGLTNLVLGGAVSGFKRFQESIPVDGGTTLFPYVIEHRSSAEFEVGITYLHSSTQLKRGGTQTVIASSNSNSPVNFTAGDKRVYISVNADWVSNLAKLNVPQAFTKQQYVSQANLTDGTTVSWNLDNAQVAKLTLGGNRVLDNPSNMKAGATYILHVYQDGTGGRLITFGSAYKWADDTPPTLSTAAGAHDILSFISDGTYLFGAAQLGYSV